MKNAKPRWPVLGRWRPFGSWWWVLALGLVGFSALLVPLLAWQGPMETLSYGQFRKQVLAKEIRTVTIAPTHLTGELLSKNAKGRPQRFYVAWQGIEQDPELPVLLDRHVADYEYARGTDPLLRVLFPIVIASILLLSLWIISRRGGFGSAMVFAKSRHKVYDGAQGRVTFEDVAGIDEAVEELREVVEFLQTPEKYQALGGRIPKGILLVGPPGTGKTLLARAVAGEAGVPFFSMSGSDFMEMFVGVGAARVRNLFSQAEAKAPCLVFIDEIDAIGKARGAGGSGAHDERDQTLNQLLVAMDGFDSGRGIIVMAATNRPETLDPALVRPGRFDRNVGVDRPDIGGREEILRVHVRNVPLGEELDLRQIAAMTAGFVGAELANLVNEAALLAARKGKDRVDHHDFEQGFERLLAGPEKKRRVIREDERRRIAVHEAGHALVSRSLPGTDPVHKISIVGRGNGMGGFTLYRPEEDQFLHTKSWLLHTIQGLLGGTLAEEIVLGDISDGATSDLQRATQIARKMVTDFGMSPLLGRVSYQPEGRSPFLPSGGAGQGAWSEQTAREIDLEVRRIVEECLANVREILSQRRAALDELTEQLLVHETIDAGMLQAVLDRHPIRSSQSQDDFPAHPT